MSLSVSQREEFSKALLDAYPSKFDLTKLLDKLDKNLEAITHGNDLEEIIFTIIKKAGSQGWIDKLIEAAIAGNSENEAMHRFYESYKQSEAVKPGKPHNASKPIRRKAPFLRLPKTSEKKSSRSQRRSQSGDSPALLPSEKVVEKPARTPSSVDPPPRKTPVAAPNGDTRSPTDEALHLARKHVSEANTHFQAAKGLFDENGNIRLLRCRKSISHLKAINESLGHLSTLLHTDHNLPRLITSHSQQYMITLDRINELTQSSIVSIKDFRPAMFSSKNATISQAVSRTYDDLARELDRLVEIFHQ